MNADATLARAPTTEVSGSTPDAPSLEQFLDDIAVRAYRFAEAGLRSRDDAQDAVQDTMIGMLGYHDRPTGDGMDAVVLDGAA